MDLVFLVFLPAFAALLVTLLPRNRLSYWTIAIPPIVFVYLLSLIGTEESLAVNIPWIPSIGVNLEFWVDGLGLLFGLIISGMGTLVLLYASSYFDDLGEYIRFGTYTLLFMTAMLGIVFSSNLLLLFVFWELTSITSYLLIGFRHENENAREGARTALLVTGGGGLALMAGVLLVGVVAGSFSLPVVLESGDLLRNHPLYSLMLILILIGAFSKSAQWPLHFWLPGAMEAPTPASAFLHSATMVKAGIFLLARLSLVLNNTPLWINMVTIVGLLTFLYAAIIALRQVDLKAILAYSTVSWLGILVALQGTGSVNATKALVIGIIAHALYKGALFLMAGSVDHGTGTRDIRLLGGLARKMPFTTIGAVIAALSMAGIPPLLGFLAKETLKVASLDSTLGPLFSVVFPVVAVIGSALTVAVALRIVWDTFFGQESPNVPHHPHEASITMWIAPVMLGSLTIVMPLMLPQLVEPLLIPALTAITGKHYEVHLHLFEGINAPFLMSLVAIAFGVMLFVVRGHLITWLRAKPELNPSSLYHWLFLQVLPDGARALTERLQNGSLRFYIGVVMTSFVILSVGIVVLSGASAINFEAIANFDWQMGIICVLLMIGAVAGAAATTRLSAIVIFGIEGALLSLTFALFGAPDLAFTQLMIEVVSLVLFVLAFHFLPDAFALRQSLSLRIRDFFIAAMVGVTVTILVLVTDTQSVAPSISPWYLDNAYLLGHGHNVVNVILVDFRGLDTQGEIIVLVIAAMGVAALLRLRPSDQPRGRHFGGNSVNVYDAEDDTMGEE